jgi:hypothetical protein
METQICSSSPYNKAGFNVMNATAVTKTDGYDVSGE